MTGSGLMSGALLPSVDGSFVGIDTLIHERARLNIMAQLYVLESADFLSLMRQTGLTFDKLTKGAEFWEQNHRSRMDKRRITLKLLRPTGGRKLFAEVDRVWAIQPGPISQPVTYVLECKWGLVRKESLEDFLNVLKWSMDFGYGLRFRALRIQLCL